MALKNTVIKLLQFTLHSPPVTIVLDGLGFWKFRFQNLLVLMALYVLRFWMIFSACWLFQWSPMYNNEWTSLNLGWVGLVTSANDKKLAPTCVQVCSRPKWTRVKSTPGSTDSQGDLTCMYSRVRLAVSHRDGVGMGNFSRFFLVILIVAKFGPLSKYTLE